MFIDNENATSQDFRHFVAPSLAQAEVLRSVLTSKLYTFMVGFFVTSNRLTNYAVTNCPEVDLTRTWTGDELYAHFGLTQEEIDFIEATV
jgi:site-specific DNA-methyltransferase (adenine-specific)